MMGYSKSIRAVRRVEPILKQLVVAQGNLEFPSSNSGEDAYYIRDGIKASAHHAIRDNEPNEPYYSYSQLNVKYVFKAAAGKVVAALRDVVTVRALASAHASMSVPDVDDDLSIIGAAITHRAPRMYFPDAGAESVDLHSVYNWARENNYHIVVGDGITLTQDDPGKLAWKP